MAVWLKNAQGKKERCVLVFRLTFILESILLLFLYVVIHQSVTL